MAKQLPSGNSGSDSFSSSHEGMSSSREESRHAAPSNPHADLASLTERLGKKDLDHVKPLLQVVSTENKAIQSEPLQAARLTTRPNVEVCIKAVLSLVNDKRFSVFKVGRPARSLHPCCLLPLVSPHCVCVCVCFPVGGHAQNGQHLNISPFLPPPSLLSCFW